MLNRRDFLSVSAAGLWSSCLWGAESTASKPPLKMAIIATEWRYRSHAWHMGERFLAGYPLRGRWHQPPLQVVSAYVDQFPASDLSRGRARDFGFTIYPSIAEALRCGSKELAVDAVLIIGEHGDYPLNEYGQKQYPRYQFFKQVTDVFKQTGRSLPVFNDKHLSWNYAWAKEMVELSYELKFPFLAGSSLPVTWRMPAVDMPYGAEVEEVLALANGPVDIYDFHALEMLQCMAERRKGGETGVKSVQGLRGPAVWKAMEAKAWSPRLFEACLCRSQTLTQAPTNGHRYPTPEQIREWVQEPVAYLIEYNDGLKGTMLQFNGLVEDFTFAARIKGQEEPLSTLFYLPPGPNVVYSAALMSQAERMFVTGEAPYRIERTLLTSGLVAAGMQSLATGQAVLATPHLNVVYQAPEESFFWKD